MPTPAIQAILGQCAVWSQQRVRFGPQNNNLAKKAAAFFLQDNAFRSEHHLPHPPPKSRSSGAAKRTARLTDLCRASPPVVVGEDGVVLERQLAAKSRSLPRAGRGKA